jgi:hypothetical protein
VSNHAIEKGPIMLIRVGDTVINLDNVVRIDLNWVPDDEEDEEPQVVFEFLMRGADELDEGQNIAHPYLLFFEGEEASAIRNYLRKQCPDLLDTE